MDGPTVRVIYEGVPAPHERVTRLESMLARHFPPGFETYVRVDVAWRGQGGWEIRRAVTSIGRDAMDITRSLIACIRAEGIPVASPLDDDRSYRGRLAIEYDPGS